MTAAAAFEDDVASVKAWFAAFGAHVAGLDYAAARVLFAEDVIAFGTKVERMVSRQALEEEQWRAIWPMIEDYRHDLATLEVSISRDRLMAVGVTLFSSTGFHEDGSRFARPGRVTAVLTRAAPGAAWRAIHTHLSLKPGTPPRSYGKR